MEDLSRVTAAILAGGMGTRLRNAVADRPKVLAPVLGKPFLAYLLDSLADAGLRDVVLCTGYRAEMVQAEFGSHYRNLSLRYSCEPSPLGTAGALRNVLTQLTTPDVLVMNGDSYCSADLPAMLAAHCIRNAAATLTLVEVADVSRFGRVETDAQGQVVRFDEKGCRTGRGWINAGVYLLGRNVLESIPAQREVSLEREVFPAWIGRGLWSFASGDSRFLDIGTPESYALATEFFSAKASCVRSRRFVLVDRDGTLIRKHDYLADPDLVELLPGVADGLRRLRNLGFGLVVVSNQSGVGRGLFDESRVAAIHQRMSQLLAAQGITLDGIYYCPHLPTAGCRCRKPLPGMVERAASELQFDPSECVVIGDNLCDVELGTQLGVRSILVRTGHGADVESAAQADCVVDDFAQAATLAAQWLAAR
jgi:histidinol-phosphate phosphatase family protein